jgi:Flp pilus assembly protein TadD
MSRPAKPTRVPAVTAVERARRQSQRGDPRRAMLILREACFAADSDARLWVLYGMQCLRARKPADAMNALSHALWLRERASDHARARVMRELIAHLESGGELPRAA